MMIVVEIAPPLRMMLLDPFRLRLPPPRCIAPSMPVIVIPPLRRLPAWATAKAYTAQTQKSRASNAEPVATSRHQHMLDLWSSMPPPVSSQANRIASQRPQGKNRHLLYVTYRPQQSFTGSSQLLPRSRNPHIRFPFPLGKGLGVRFLGSLKCAVSVIRTAINRDADPSSQRSEQRERQERASDSFAPAKPVPVPFLRLHRASALRSNKQNNISHIVRPK